MPLFCHAAAHAGAITPLMPLYAAAIIDIFATPRYAAADFRFAAATPSRCHTTLIFADAAARRACHCAAQPIRRMCAPARALRAVDKADLLLIPLLFFVSLPPPPLAAAYADARRHASDFAAFAAIFSLFTFSSLRFFDAIIIFDYFRPAFCAMRAHAPPHQIAIHFAISPLSTLRR